MRTVAFLGLVAEIDADVALSTKARVAGGICFSKAMFWDSKYHVSRPAPLPTWMLMMVLLMMRLMELWCIELSHAKCEAAGCIRPHIFSSFSMARRWYSDSISSNGRSTNVEGRIRRAHIIRK